jgi:hypothetical protein
LPFPRSPQGHPVLVQAGQSGAGAGLAARYAELVFSGPPSLAEQLCAIARARPGASLREVAQQVTGGAGQTHFIGTPEQLAAHVVAWQDAVGLQAPSGFVVVAIGTAAMAISPCLGLSPYVWLSIGASLTGLGNGLANPASRNACLQVAPDEVGPAGAAPTACTTNTSHPVRHNPICMVVTP